MSLLTRCPACTTLYKVVPDQLRISQGWVKCGQCGEIFDASQHLMEASTEPEELVTDSSADAVQAHADEPAGGEPMQPPDDHAQAQPGNPPPDRLPEGEPLPGPDIQPESDYESEPVPQNDAVPEVTAAVEGGPWLDTLTDENMVSHDDAVIVPPEWAQLNLASLAPVSSEHSLEVAVEPVPEPVQASAPEPSQETHQEPEPEPESEPESPAADSAAVPVSFMRTADQPTRWWLTKNNAVLLGLAGLLAVVMGAQWVYQDHDRLAASRPSWKPALEKMCSVLRCAVKPLQQIEAIAIDSAAFSKVGPDSYRLSFALKNTVSMALAWPSIELTLTDAEERVVVRRVLSPPELSLADSLSASSEWPVAVNLRVKAEAATAAVVGYRLLAFYP